MNATIRRTAIAMALLFVALLINVNVIAIIQGPQLRLRQGNTRLIVEEYGQERGSILVGGEAIARSKPTKGRLKYERVYKHGAMYAPATGYYSVYGATQIEHYENDLLSGNDGRLIVDRMTNLLTGRAPRGGSVILTIDPKAQKAAYRAMGNLHGAVVALDPRTGAILAMVSKPSYNTNLLSSHDAATVNKNYNRLLHAPGNPLINRPLVQTYPPGSLFKVVVSAAALESGRYTPSTQIPAPATIDLPQTTATLSNYDHLPCNGGQISLAEALAISCNTAFAHVGLDLGGSALQAEAEKFGFNQVFEVPMPSAQSVFPRGLNPPETAQSAIGQFDVRATALQMAVVGAGVADGGLVMKPYLVAQERAPDLSVLSATEPQVFDRAMGPTAAASLTDMMVGVVDAGTGGNAAIAGVAVAGKTGTAETGVGRPPDVWFLSFAPADNPQVVVAVVVENGGGLGNRATGGALAAPVAKAVMEAVLNR